MEFSEETRILGAVTGEIEEFREAPEIILRDRTQLKPDEAS
jgi:hypothetical protein